LVHAYVTFRFHLACHGLRQFAASLKSSAEILLLLGANVVIALFALSAFPPMYAASLAPLPAIGLLLAHAVGMTIPVALLRKRVLPADVVRWAHWLPIPPSLRWRADAVVAGLLVGPLALLYAVSATILLYQHPAWLRPAGGVAATALSLVLTYACSTGLLALRSRRVAGPSWRRARPMPARAYAAGGCGRACCCCGIACSGCPSGAPRTWSAGSRA
jgi:hypothetical protein